MIDSVFLQFKAKEKKPNGQTIDPIDLKTRGTVMSTEVDRNVIGENRWSPDVILETRSIGNCDIWIAREDLLPGGTKQRAVIPYLRELSALGYRQLAYASPFCGYAQVALAVRRQNIWRLTSSVKPIRAQVDVTALPNAQRLSTHASR